MSRFTYQQLQYCPQRNISSISKTKEFNSTVSKYDPRTGRTTKLQFCVEIPKPLGNPNIEVFFNSPSQLTLFVFIVKGSGVYDVGNGIRNNFSALSFPTEVFCNVLPGKSFKLYSNNITQFTLDNQPMTSIELQNAKTLEVIELVDCGNYDPVSFDVSIFPNLTRLSVTTYFNFSSLIGIGYCRNLRTITVGQGFPQANVDSVVNQIIQAGIYNGTLNISYQTYASGGNPNLSGSIYNTLRNTYGWTIL